MKREELEELNRQQEAKDVVPGALRWLYDLEQVTSPHLLNNLYLNIYAQSSHIKDVDLLIDKENRKMLIYMRFGFIANTFRRVKLKVLKNTLDNVQKLLPAFEFRIVEDRALFDKSLRIAKRAVALDLQLRKGVKNENPIAKHSNERGIDSTVPTISEQSSTGPIETAKPETSSDLQADKKE
jgi:hypothetical protein